MTNKNMSIDELAKLLGVEFEETLAASEVRALQNALPGYKAIVDDTSRLCKKHGKTLNLGESVLENLKQGLIDVNRLEPIEKLLEKLSQSVYHQRLQATAKCMEGLYDSSRRIREFANAYPEIQEEGQYLMDFMKAFKPGRKSDKKKSE